MTTQKLEKKFILSYGGECEYLIGGVKYSARSMAWVNFSWNGDYFETGIKPSIGCVRYDESSRWHEFPPAEVMALFPGYVPLRLVYHKADDLPITHPDHKLGTMEYIHDGPSPVLIDNGCGGITSVAVKAAQDAEDAAYRAKQSA